MRRTALITLLTAMVACRAAPVTHSGAVTTDSAGATIITNWTPTWTAANAWRVDSAPVTDIGADPSDPHQQFKYVVATARLANGDIVVPAGGELRWFDPRGHYIRTAPVSGAGPGEFRDIADVIARGDTVTVYGDFMLLKGAVFGPDGALLRELHADYARLSALGKWNECNLSVFADGSRIGCHAAPGIRLKGTDGRPANAAGQPGLMRQPSRVYIMPATLDTAYPAGIDGGIEQFVIERGARGVSFLHPFYSFSPFAAGGAPLRFVMATNPDYSIGVWTMRGQLEHIIRRANARIAVTDAERRDADTMITAQLAQRHDTSDPGTVIRQIPAPDSLPAVLGLAVAPDGTLFVTRSGEFASDPHTAVDVFDPSGRWLGTLSLPSRVRIIQAGMDFLLGVRRDSSDVPHVVVYALHR